MQSSWLTSHGGIVTISSFKEFQSHTLLLTATGDVYGWGNNHFNQVFPHLTGPPANDDSDFIHIPVKLPLSNIVSISAGMNHSLAVAKDGAVYGWGGNQFHQINQSSMEVLPFTKITLNVDITNVYASNYYSLGLTVDGAVVMWKLNHAPMFIHGLIDIYSIKLDWQYFVALGKSGCLKLIKFDSNFFNFTIHIINLSHSSLPKPLLPLNVATCFPKMFIVDQDHLVWQFDIEQRTSFPTKVQGLSSIKSIVAGNDFYGALGTDGKVYLFGDLQRIFPIYEPIDQSEVYLVKEFDNVKFVAAGDSFFFAVSNHFTFYCGHYELNQMTNRPHIIKATDNILPSPLKVFGSEINGCCGSRSFDDQIDYSTETILFPNLIKLIFHYYLEYLEGFFIGHYYLLYRFLSKLVLSKNFYSLAKTVLESYDFVKQVTNPTQIGSINKCKSLQLRMSSLYHGMDRNINILSLCLLTDDLFRDLNLLSLFPNVISLKIFKNGPEFLPCSLDSSGLNSLKFLEIGCVVNGLYFLPKSIRKLVIHGPVQNFDVSYLEDLQHLAIYSGEVCEKVLCSGIGLPDSILKLEVSVFSEECLNRCKLSKLRELVTREGVFSNLNAFYFPLLKFVEIQNNFAVLIGSDLCPNQFNKNGVIKSSVVWGRSLLVELSCFPWWVQYPICEDVDVIMKST
ncbi:hypothetical protein P9112_000700 [Eukaryota sp. TZLM1-RC]